MLSSVSGVSGFLLTLIKIFFCHIVLSQIMITVQNSLKSSKWGKKLILIVFMGQKKGIKSDYGVKN